MAERFPFTPEKRDGPPPNLTSSYFKASFTMEDMLDVLNGLFADAEAQKALPPGEQNFTKIYETSRNLLKLLLFDLARLETFFEALERPTVSGIQRTLDKEAEKARMGDGKVQPIPEEKTALDDEEIETIRIEKPEVDPSAEEDKATPEQPLSHAPKTKKNRQRQTKKVKMVYRRN